MLALIVIAGLQLVLHQRSISTAAFMLQRAETSHRQLDAYQQLSIGLLEFIMAGEPAARGWRQEIDKRLGALDRLVTYEVDLVLENGGDETNVAERQRLNTIQAAVERMFAARSTSSGLAGLYRSTAKPLLDEAILGETTEIGLVEQSMRDMRQRILWLGWIGVLMQVAMVGIVFGVVERAVLGPLKRLVSDIRELGRGRLTHRVTVLRHDEFGLLGRHVNRMARQLDHRNNELLGMNSALEATVAERTGALRARNDELKEIDDSRRRFFVDVSHELRTPLTAIVGEADVTLRDPKTTVAMAREALASILANATYLNRRIDDLMALARSSNGRLDLELRTIDLNLVAAEAMAEIRSLARVNKVDVHFEPLTKPVFVGGDRTRLLQCLMILLDNAVKFTPAGRNIHLCLSEVATTGQLSVIDEGRGIAAAELPVVFERFYQTEVGRRMGGTGIGLAIARRIVEAHRGTIAATKIDGGGTAMIVQLPLTEGEDT